VLNVLVTVLEGCEVIKLQGRSQSIWSCSSGQVKSM